MNEINKIPGEIHHIVRSSDSVDLHNIEIHYFFGLAFGSQKSYNLG